MKKVKSWLPPVFDDVQVVSKKSRKPEKTTQNSSVHKSEIKENNSVVLNANINNCLKQFSPKCLDDLAVNPKKLEELQAWICSSCRLNKARLLLLSGPIGCGKTEAVQLLCKLNKIKLVEWITPLDIDIPNDNGDYEFRDKHSKKFIDFLLKAANFTSLLDKDSNTNKLVLVEDLPNVFLKHNIEFSSVLEEYKERAKSPLIFICSDTNTDSTSTPIGLFTNVIKEKYQIEHIIFNAISTTNMRAALKRTAQVMCEQMSQTYNVPTNDIIECVINSSLGDIRSAIMNLHFASLKGSNFKPEEVTMAAKSDCKSKGRKKTSHTKFAFLGKDQTVNILHGVGRVLNPKVNENGKFTHNPIDIVNEFSCQPKSFVNFIHENYLPHYSDIKQAEQAICYLSDADLMLAEWTETHSKLYGLYVATAGVMLSNINPISAWNPVKGPKSSLIKYPTSGELELLDENQLYTGKDLVSDYKTYCEIIKKL